MKTPWNVNQQTRTEWKEHIEKNYLLFSGRLMCQLIILTCMHVVDCVKAASATVRVLRCSRAPELRDIRLHIHPCRLFSHGCSLLDINCAVSELSNACSFMCHHRVNIDSIDAFAVAEYTIRKKWRMKNEKENKQVRRVSEVPLSKKKANKIWFSIFLRMMIKWSLGHLHA